MTGTGIMKSNFQRPKLTENQSGVRMKFWGVTCIGEKGYKQAKRNRFHLTMAVLDPRSDDQEVRDKIVTLSVFQHEHEFLLCVLKHGEIHQANLNLIFDKEDDVIFKVTGCGIVHLTGYQIDSSDDAVDMDNENYCPLAEVEIESEKTKNKKSNIPVNPVDIKEKRKGKVIRAMMGDINGGDDEDEDDSDFAIESEEIEESSSDSESEDEDDEDDIDDEIDEEELLDVLKEREEMEITPKTEKSQKRKREKMSLPQKRIKSEELNKSKLQEVSEVSEAKSEESDSDDAGGMNTSIGNTPMPKKQDDSSKAKKKNKNRKRLSEISNLGKPEKVDDLEEKLPKDKSTPSKNKGENKPKYPVVKLEGGVEYQDVIVGRGPEAVNGKAASVFYMGRLADKTIFDSRVPPKKPFTFRLGVPEVIRGLDIGIKGMKVGGQRKLKVPPHMGYGSKGINNVPPNSTLYFTIELQSVS